MAKQKPTKEEYQSDVLDLCRKILGGVQLRDITWADGLKGQEKIEFLKYCSFVSSHPMFEKIFAMLYFPHVEEAALRAENYDIVSFHRASANGVNLTKEFFLKYHRQYEEEFAKDPDKFAEGENEEHKAFSSVG